MARRDSRSRNNRLKINETEEVTRPVTRKHTRTVPGQTSTQTLDGYKTWNTDRTKFYAGSDAGFYKDDVDPYLIETSAGSGEFQTYEGGRPVDVKFEDIDSYRVGGHYFARDRAEVSVTQPDTEQTYETTEYKTETRSSSRYQALDKRDSDDDSQRKRKLKTNREGRSKLRIKMKGDGSASRLREGPNAGRKRNKLKVDVQGGGGQPGVNVPR